MLLDIKIMLIYKEMILCEKSFFKIILKLEFSFNWIYEI